MPTHKSAAKRMKTAERDRLKNRTAKTTLRSAVKEFKSKKSADEKQAGIKQLAKALDKAVHKGVIHKNKAARTKSRMAKALKAKS